MDFYLVVSPTGESYFTYQCFIYERGYSAKHELWGACAPKRVRRRIETVFSHADLECCDDSDHFVTPPPNFGNDRRVKFLAVALHSHLNNGPDCCHRFVERAFMAEKKLPSTIIRWRGKKCSNTQTVAEIIFASPSTGFSSQ